MWEKGKTPINVVNLEKYLANYPKRIDAELLLNGFSEGFKLQYAGPRFSSSTHNLLSAELHQDETLVKLKNEIDLGRMLGPFSTKPISSLRISPIGLVQKSDNSWRLISHLSFPSGSSVNMKIFAVFYIRHLTKL